MALTNSDVDAQGNIKLGAPGQQLYNLRDDLRQATNRFSASAQIAHRLAARLDELLPPAKLGRKANP